MIPNPILKVLSTIRKHEVKALLMGGQACVFYGAAEFSRDTDLSVLADIENLRRLRTAMDELQAGVVAVPDFELSVLLRGHAVHFRCRHPDASGMRVDIMSKLRGVDSFNQLWERRTTIVDPAGEHYDLLSLPDLVKAKKTQRDKDWPMVRRLIEANYFSNREKPTAEQIDFWLMEGRTPSILIELATNHPKAVQKRVERRSLLRHALVAGNASLDAALIEEEREQRELDRDYWRPLREELEQMRRQISSERQ